MDEMESQSHVWNHQPAMGYHMLSWCPNEHGHASDVPYLQKKPILGASL